MGVEEEGDEVTEGLSFLLLEIPLPRARQLHASLAPTNTTRVIVDFTQNE